MLTDRAKKASRSGGKSIEKLKRDWKSTNYEFKIFYHEFSNINLVEENQTLRKDKRKAEQDMTAEQVKRMKLDETLKNVIAREEKTKTYYKEKFKSLVKRVVRIQNIGKKGPNKT